MWINLLKIRTYFLIEKKKALEDRLRYQVRYRVPWTLNAWGWVKLLHTTSFLLCKFLWAWDWRWQEEVEGRHGMPQGPQPSSFLLLGLRLALLIIHVEGDDGRKWALYTSCSQTARRYNLSDSKQSVKILLPTDTHPPTDAKVACNNVACNKLNTPGSKNASWAELKAQQNFPEDQNIRLVFSFYQLREWFSPKKRPTKVLKECLINSQVSWAHIFPKSSRESKETQDWYTDKSKSEKTN